MREFWYRLKSTGTVILCEEKNLIVRIIESFREGCLGQRTESFALLRVIIKDGLRTPLQF
jgi:hypothetical protein